MNNTNKRGFRPFGAQRRRRCFRFELLEVRAVPAALLAPTAELFVPADTVEVAHLTAVLPTLAVSTMDSGNLGGYLGGGEVSNENASVHVPLDGEIGSQEVLGQPIAGDPANGVLVGIGEPTAHETAGVDGFATGNGVEVLPHWDPIGQLTVDPRVAVSFRALELETVPTVRLGGQDTEESNLDVTDTIDLSGMVSPLVPAAHPIGEFADASQTTAENSPLIDSITLNDMPSNDNIINRVDVISHYDNGTDTAVEMEATSAAWALLSGTLNSSLQALHRDSLIMGPDPLADQLVDLALLDNSTATNPAFALITSGPTEPTTVDQTFGLDVPYIDPDETIDLRPDNTSVELTTVDIGGILSVDPLEIGVYGPAQSGPSLTAVSPVSLGALAVDRPILERRNVSTRLVELGFEASDSLTARYRPVELVTATHGMDVSGSAATDTAADHAADESFSPPLDLSETSLHGRSRFRSTGSEARGSAADENQPAIRRSVVEVAVRADFEHGLTRRTDERLEAGGNEDRSAPSRHFGEFSNPAVDMFVVVFGCFAASILSRQLDSTNADMGNVIRPLV